MSPLDTLTELLRPAGGGVYVVSTGVAEQRALQQAIYQAPTPDAITARWQAALARVPDARVVVLGVPADNGAGFTRGSNRAPAKLRGHLLGRAHPLFSSDVIDVGDVRVVPHLLADEMLGEAQIAACRGALFGDTTSTLPVAPLDMTRAALDALRALNPQIIPVVIGGDHSVGWPAFASAFAHWEQRLSRRVGLLHFDAHTDLLAERLGVKYCFATWAYHANELLGRDGRLVQVGIRASGRDQAHWESTLGVRQYWPAETEALGVEAVAAQIIARFERLGVEVLYVSNDIDATDPAWAAATGTPEPGGLSPDFVSALTARVAAAFPLIGGDLVEVAPPLAGEVLGEPARTLDTAGRYLSDLIKLG